MNDCTLCLEWEICPFHKPEPKSEPEPEMTKYTIDAEADTVRIVVTQPTVIHGSTPAGTVTLKNGRIVSDCGDYIQTYIDGKLVDEEPSD